MQYRKLTCSSCAGGGIPTDNLISKQQLEFLPDNALLINACRGGVVDEEALKTFLASRKDVCTVFDVWLNEPQPDLELVTAIDVSTPHIAGYSREAKSTATLMMRNALMKSLGLIQNSLADDEAGFSREPIVIPEQFIGSSNEAWYCILQAMPIEDISAKFKSSILVGDAAVFDVMRSDLRNRREFCALSLIAAANPTIDESQQKFLETLGFTISG